MPKTVHDGFTQFINKIAPSNADIAKAAIHKSEIRSRLEYVYGVNRILETGSLGHRTGIKNYSDADFLVSLKSPSTRLSSSILTSVRDNLLVRFPTTSIHVSRPAVVLDFGQGYERVEIIPAYPIEKLPGDVWKYKIPGVVTEWMNTTPEAHLKYVNDCNTRPVKHAAKAMARLIKAWKYYCDVPISSFYLEMRAAEYINVQKSFNYSLHLYSFIKWLNDISLASLNDPTGYSGRIYACSSDANKAIALSKLGTANSRAFNANEYVNKGRIDLAYQEWDKLFNSNFPAYY